MTVKDLKLAIENLPDDMEVILQKDAESNEYSPLESYDTELTYIPKNTWSGTTVYDPKSNNTCLTLSPVN